MGGTLLFDEEKHEYHLQREDGHRTRLPSVSQVMQNVGILNYAKTTRNTEAMSFGTAVHKATEIVDTSGDSSPYEALALFSDPLVLPFVEQWMNFKKISLFQMELCEKRLFHPTHLFAGTIDRYGTITTETGEECKVLIDIKTGEPHTAVVIQLAAYRELLRANNFDVDFCIALYLKEKNFTPTHISVKYSDFSVFLSALTIYRWKERNLGRSFTDNSRT